jgi:hypothetical protein
VKDARAKERPGLRQRQATDRFCLPAERSENKRPRLGLQDDLFGRRRRDANAEARLQAAIVEWIRAVAPSVLVFAIPNGGYRTPAEAARMRWTGVLAGVPDLCIVAPGGRVHFIEVKTTTGSLSDAQRAVHDAMVALGTPPAVCRSLEDARRAIAAWDIPTRARS